MHLDVMLAEIEWIQIRRQRREIQAFKGRGSARIPRSFWPECYRYPWKRLTQIVRNFRYWCA